MISRKTALIIAIPIIILLLMIAYDRRERAIVIDELCEELWDWKHGDGDLTDIEEIVEFIESGEYSNYVDFRTNCIDYFEHKRP